jgi:hypothetical protein
MAVTLHPVTLNLLEVLEVLVVAVMEMEFNLLVD